MTTPTTKISTSTTTTTSTSPRSSSSPTEGSFDLAGARVRFTGRREGDLGFTAGDDVQARRTAVLGLPWSWLRQVHGNDVVTVASSPVHGAEADALVTAQRQRPLAIFTADCAPIALSAPEGVIGAVHAGWRGTLSGVVEGAVEKMRALGASTVSAALGPCIHAECYEFSPGDLDRVAAVLGDEVRGQTAAGQPALDLPAAVRVALDRAGGELVVDASVCTACSPEYFSFRAGGDACRQAMLVWLP